MPDSHPIPPEAWSALYHASAAFHSTLVSAKVLETIVEHALRAFNADGAAVYRLDPDGRTLVCAATLGACSTAITPLDDVNRAVLSGEFVRIKGDHSLACAPLAADNFIGMLCICPQEAVAGTDEWRLREFADQAASALSHALHYEALQKSDQQRTEFVHVVTHELRSPVVGAQSLLRVLLQGLIGELTPQQQDILNRLSQRMDSLLALINDLLALAAARTRADQPLERLDLTTVARESADTFVYDAKEKAVALNIQGVEHHVPVRATHQGLRRILDNLVGNAVKYTPNGGNVIVEITRKGDQAVIQISDSGIGIPKEALERIGETFFRASNAQSSGIIGTGLGLATVKALIDGFDGVLEITSEVGKGSTFTVYLPLNGIDPTPSA